MILARNSNRLSLIVLLISLLFTTPACAQESQKELRRQAKQLFKDGNHAEAFEVYEQLCLDLENEFKQPANDLSMAMNCLKKLNRSNETDAFIERIVALHQENWRLLNEAARSYNYSQHQGYLIAGEFQRGSHRGGGKYVGSFKRDRCRAIQLMLKAKAIIESGEIDDSIRYEVGNFYVEFAEIIVSTYNSRVSWQLQLLTDLATLPDYEEVYYQRGDRRGAPVDADGKPVFYYLPDNFEAANSDGERWRWCLQQASRVSPRHVNEVKFKFGLFLQRQFGVQTMKGFVGFRGGLQSQQEEDQKSGVFALHTLAENETIARLATGIQRFTLPEEFNYIRIFKEVITAEAHLASSCLIELANIFENRRQFDRAVEYLELSKKYWQESSGKRIEKIIGNQGVFEPVTSQPAGKGATVDYRYRNGSEVEFTAYQIKREELVADFKAYLKSNPKEFNQQKIDLNRIGERLVRDNETKYIGEVAAKWSLELEPDLRHFDRRITITTPLQKPGAYLLIAELKNGNTSRIIIWLSDTAIIKKHLEKETLYYVADAVTGEPIAKANVEFIAWQQEWVENEKRHIIKTINFAEYTDADGQVILDGSELPTNYKCLIIATTEDGRLAYHGLNYISYVTRHDRGYNRIKTLFITDRPVYRPNQTVKFKAWRRLIRYDQSDKSEFAKTPLTVEIFNPKNEKIYDKKFIADEYGGLDGELILPKDAILGVYRIRIKIRGREKRSGGEELGGNTFRVEEYKKPEFEVTIISPEKPVMLGEKVVATVEAKYYFGAPVTNAEVKYKVLRYSHEARWFPPMPWDWFYGPGYWWFGYDYSWYPGWRSWGCRRPLPWWGNRSTPPEVVIEDEAAVGPDGKLTITIDTMLAKELHGDTDHRYEITAEVRDESRRTIVGTGTVLIARKPFSVKAWVDRGYYHVGDTVHADFKAQTLAHKPVTGKGSLRLLRINYGQDMQPEETEEQVWTLDPDSEGQASQQFKASRAGQYRLSYTVTDGEGHSIEGGYLFVIRGEGFDGKAFRFDNIELVTDKREYAPGDEIKLMINTDRSGSTVLLFSRPYDGAYPKPKLIRMKGKSTVETIIVARKDMPNFYIEAITIADGKVHTAIREIIVPPQKRILTVEVSPSAEQYKPGEKGKLKIKLTDFTGEPYSGSAVISVYDKAVEYISGGSNTPEIKEFYWKWRRRYNSQTEHNLLRHFYNLFKKKEPRMQDIGIFGHLIADEENAMLDSWREGGVAVNGVLRQNLRAKGAQPEMAMMGGMPIATAGMAAAGSDAPPETAAAVIRKEFADTALWIASLVTDADGSAEVDLPMPENLTTWKVKVWAMGHGTRVGEGSAEVITSKDLLLRMQAPRFFVQKDEVVLSANIHNYLKTTKDVTAVLELDGPCLKVLGEPTKTVKVEASGEMRVDWRVAVMEEGEAVVRMKALTDEESDAMEMRFPVFVHGIDKMVPQCGVIRPENEKAVITIEVPEERRINASRLEIRYSPSLAMAMIDALPYLVSYPYGCTEQTLNRFLPTVLTQKTLQRMGVSLKDIAEKRSNLNAQEVGDDLERAKDWKHYNRNPVFDEDEVARMVKQGVKDLTAMQLSDGGWGWFSGYREKSTPHTTALVMHGLLLARENGIAIVPGVVERGVEWLKNHQAARLTEIKDEENKRKADNRDAFVYMVLSEAGIENEEMREFLYRDRDGLSVNSKAMYGLALHRQGQAEKLAMIMRNIEQYLVNDNENQTAHLNLPNGSYWWYWYGSEMEAHAYYLKLLARVEPKSEKASRLVKYMLNNRKHASWWNSTRDTALCVEAFADYLKASGEDKPDMTLEVLFDDQVMKEVTINAENLFTYDNKFVLTGDAVDSGTHKIELRKKGAGPLYFNAYLSYFTLEDPITSAGLEIKVDRQVYKLKPVEKTIAVSGAHGQALGQKVEKFERELLASHATLKSGDLIEVELIIESKNDYEYLIFEDMKAAGFEPADVRSGYTGNEMGAYVEFRDERVSFFVRWLARGKHSVTYRLRAEIPGRFSALPARGYAMYSPELRGNSNEIKLIIED